MGHQQRGSEHQQHIPKSHQHDRQHLSGSRCITDCNSSRRKAPAFANARRWQDEQADQEKARRTVELFLRMRGVEQMNTESMFDAFSRALGISNRELRAQMLAGINPIAKWFTENGIYDRNKKSRRNLAGG